MTQTVENVGADADIRASLISRATELRPLLRAHAKQADSDRRIPQASIDAVIESGVFDVWTPKRYGGFEADMATQVEILSELAQGDPAVAWVGSLYTGCAFSMSKLTDEAQDEVWGDNPSVMSCGILTPAGTAKKVPGGYRISGSWPFASGSYHAKWCMLSVPLLNDDGDVADVGFMLVLMADVHIKETWFTLGMRGTGSNTIIGEDVFVPEHRVLPMLDETGQMNPKSLSTQDVSGLYKVPYGSLASLWMIGVPLGIARAALAYALEQMPKRSISYSTYTKQTESVTTQVDMADAATMIDTAYLLARRAAADADRVVNHSEEIDMVTRGRIRQDCGYGAKLVRAAVDSIMMQCGASSVADFNPLQQSFRDITTCTLHAFVRPSLMAEVYGRTLLGLEPSVTIC